MANYNISGGFADTHDNLKNFSNKYSVADSGPYVGVIKDTEDPLRMGRLGVVIPALANRNVEDPSIDQLVWCQYLTPFYGAKPFKAVSKTDPYSSGVNQTSYGMWAIPPDIDTNVLVIFAKGEKNKSNAFWIGCIQEPLTNHMVPGNASSSNTSVGVDQVGDMGTHGKKEIYGTTIVPALEKNKKRYEDGEGIESLQKWKLPINEELADQLNTQGLIKDTVRGTTTSSARRESPSAVFGISTPGRIKSDSRTPNIGLEGTPVSVDRHSGHSFVMDDGDRTGKNQLTRLRTASGHQLLMNDSDGVVYIANGSGNAWIEMTRDGRIDVYSGVGGINLRTEGDFNLHSDSNINMSAGQSIRMSATGQEPILYTKDDTAVKEGQKVEGDVKGEASPGVIVQSADYLLSLGDKGVFTSSQEGPTMTYGKEGILSYSDNQQIHGSKGPVHLAGDEVHLNSIKPSEMWGPKWLTKERVGIEPRPEGDVDLTRKGSPRILEPFTRETKTTVHRLVTHEPMFRASVVGSDGVIPLEYDDKKAHSKLANTPGTAEWLNLNNRLSINSAIRDAQYQSDALAFLAQKMGNSTNVQKAKKLLTEFGLKYNEIYGISKKLNLPFDIKDSISEKLKLGSISTIKDNLTKALSSQVIESLSNKNLKLFKDNVLVNSTGEIFSLGTTISGTISSFTNIQNTIGDLKNIKSTIGNLNSITQTFSSVVGGQIVGINQIKGLGRRVLAKFKGADIMNPNEMKNLTSFTSIGQSISKSIGNFGKSIKTFFGGGGGGWGSFCFDPNTLVQMADGSEKKIKDIKLGDNTKGGEVTGVFQFKASDEIHDYKGVTVAGSHYVKENDEFIMVKDSPLAIKIDKIPVVYSLDTSGRRIFINNIEFADYNGDGVAKNFLNNAGVDLTGFDKEVLRQVEQRLI